MFAVALIIGITTTDSGNSGGKVDARVQRGDGQRIRSSQDRQPSVGDPRPGEQIHGEPNEQGLPKRRKKGR